MKNTIILLVLLRSVRWVLCQQCYIRQYSKLGQSTKIVTDKRAYRSQAEPERRAYTSFTGYTVCIHTAANPGGRRCSALLFNVVDWFIYLPTASSTAAKTRSSPVGRGARIPLHRSPTAARAARRPLSGARRDAYKLAAAASVRVWREIERREQRGGERQEISTWASVWIRAEEIDFYWQTRAHLSLFLLYAWFRPPLPTCARCIRRSRPPGFNTVKDSYLSK